MLKMTIVLDGFNRKPIVIPIMDYKIKKSFLCIHTFDGKYICYNIRQIERFEVADDN